MVETLKELEDNAEMELEKIRDKTPLKEREAIIKRVQELIKNLGNV